MLPAEVQDLELIRLIKTEQDSDALVLLANRHTGLYQNIIGGYSYVPKIERDDLLEHKLLNIYNFAIKYDQTKDMKFSTYLGQSIKWKCQTLLSRSHNTEEFDAVKMEKQPDYMANVNKDRDLSSFIYEKAGEVPDKRFIEIFKMRHDTSPKKGWVEIADIMGLSHEGVRKIYKKNIKNLKNKINKELV